MKISLQNSRPFFFIFTTKINVEIRNWIAWSAVPFSDGAETLKSLIYCLIAGNPSTPASLLLWAYFKTIKNEFESISYCRHSFIVYLSHTLKQYIPMLFNHHFLIFFKQPFILSSCFPMAEGKNSESVEKTTT